MMPYDNSEISTRKISRSRETWNRLRKRPMAVISLAAVMLILFLGIFADLFYDYNESCVEQHLEIRYQAPSAEHLLGTDMYGRDIAARAVFGIRAALLMGGVGSIVTMLIATLLACLASYFGGWVDNVIMRILDVIACIPGLVLAIAICASLGSGMWQLIVALSFSGLTAAARMVRSKAILAANMEYVESAAALGAKTSRLLTKSILPNITDMVIVVGTGNVAMYIMLGTTLSFIGLGVKSPQPEWGLMLSEAIPAIQNHPLLALVPAVAIILMTLSVATLGDCLRDAFDPQLKGKA